MQPAYGCYKHSSSQHGEPVSAVMILVLQVAKQKLENCHDLVKVIKEPVGAAVLEPWKFLAVVHLSEQDKLRRRQQRKRVFLNDCLP